ncbi:hypothetical protein ACGFRB_15570 [Streptomyces sp. NPDC048718]|uniref:hypothetical protein n=1 Tax=Streptomyces sp. NPDC048718 TaxID=3365587 RepID=UPI003716D51F
MTSATSTVTSTAGGMSPVGTPLGAPIGTGLAELIGRADARGLAAAGLACLDRCLPLLAPAERATEVLRPVWAAVARGDGAAWGTALAKVRAELGDGGAGGTAEALVRGMLAGAPADWAEGPLRTWAGECSDAALAVHEHYDAKPGIGLLRAGELRRQQAVLESTAHGPTGLRRARELSAEGGRVLRAVVARRARTA